MAVEPVTQATESRARLIFPHGEGVDIANATTVEIAGTCVMDGVGAAPEIVGCESEHAKRTADPVVDESVTEKGTMAAVVLDHEQAHQEHGSRNGEDKRGTPAGEIID